MHYRNGGKANALPSCTEQKIQRGNFYLREISESTMMGRGMPYDAAHAAALEKYGVSPFSLYHPEVIQQFPGQFNSGWRAFWGLK